MGGDSIPSWLGSVSSSKIFPCCALKFFRGSSEEQEGAGSHSGNFLFGGKKTGQVVSKVCFHMLTDRYTARGDTCMYHMHICPKEVKLNMLCVLCVHNTCTGDTGR